MTKEILKEKACATIDAYADKIKAICASINDEPELGFKEVKTAAKVAEFMRDLGLEPQTGLAINGVKGRAKGGKPGPTAAVLGELDAVGCPTSPKADPGNRRCACLWPQSADFHHAGSCLRYCKIRCFTGAGR